MVFEDSARNYASHAPQAWQANYPTSRFAHIVYAASTTQMATSWASAKGAATVYITSLTLPDPYAALPRYWPGGHGRGRREVSGALR